MIVAVTLTSSEAESPIDAHFGRCASFCIVDTGSGEKRVITNEAGASSAHGAGIAAAQTLAREGVQVVLTGQLGPKATSTLKAAGISAFSTTASNVQQALEEYERGELKQIL